MNSQLRATVRKMQGTMQRNADNHAGVVNKLKDDITDLHRDYATELIELEKKLDGECEAEVKGTEDHLNGKWGKTLKDAKDAHVEAKEEQKR